AVAATGAAPTARATGAWAATAIASAGSAPTVTAPLSIPVAVAAPLAVSVPVARRGHFARQDGLARQAHFALAVYVYDHHVDLVAHADHVLNLLDAVIGKLGDVHQAVLAGEYLHEGPVGEDAHHFAQVDLADLGLLGEALD